MDLPTYTSIWRIEKRLYKLYDFRLPMPLPIGQLAVFAAIAVPYEVLLSVGGVPFSHTLIWLYVLPPAVATWLATRPVLEGKRLPELVRSQVRYLAEPKIWCRMAPLAERDVMVVTGRVWRMPRAGRPADRPVAMPRKLAGPATVAAPGVSAAVSAAAPGRQAAVATPGATSAVPSPRSGQWAGQREYGWGPPAQARARAWTAPPASRAGAPRAPGSAAMAEPARWPGAAVPRPARPVPADRAPAAPGSAAPAPAKAMPARSEPAKAASARSEPAQRGSARPVPAEPEPAGDGPPERRRPAITVVQSVDQATPPAVERALAGPSARRGDIRTGRVTVVPGGQRPGKPDQLQRDRARAQLPLGQPRRIVVLGCTVGAGQTVTTLLAGEVLASLRSDQVAVLDLNPGAGCLGGRAKARPALSQAASLGRSRLAVLRPGESGDEGSADPRPVANPAAAARAFADTSAQHQLVLADPSTSSVPRLLAITDLLVLVAPASAAAVSAIGMTFEWLDAHGQAGLGADSIMVMNGVSRRSVPHVEQAERVCAGRCRGIVRVPWDEVLKIKPANRAASRAPGALAGQPRGGTRGAATGQLWTGSLSPATVGAYTALAGLIVAALADPQPPTPRQESQ